MELNRLNHPYTQIINDQDVLAAIRNASNEVPDFKWTAEDISELIYDTLVIDMTTESPELINQLLAFFNQPGAGTTDQAS